MGLADVITGPSVTVEDMLAEREWRAAEQTRLLQDSSTLVMLSANVAGPVKSFPLLQWGFDIGRHLLESRLRWERLPWSLLGAHSHSGGPTAFYRVEAPAETVKEITCAVEETPELGRLLDIDVMDAQGRKLDRQEMGYPARTCLLCGQPAVLCGRSRRHSVEELQQETVRRLTSCLFSRYTEAVEQAALRAILYEVSVTPKPGLVDRSNAGAHRDMDFFTFLDSAAAIAPFFGKLFALGWNSCQQGDHLNQEIRRLGLEADDAMCRATGGVNTHKGLIFSLGLLSVAAGQYAVKNIANGWKIPTAEELCDVEKNLACRFLPELKRDETSHGRLVYTQYQAGGIRAEAASGFQSVLEWALPHLREEEGSLEYRGIWALVDLMAHVEDTNVLFRGGPKALNELSQQAKAFLEMDDPSKQELFLKRWDKILCRQGISPGGCADLLAVGYFLYFWEANKDPAI